MSFTYAKVFFANLVENLDNFLTQGFGRKHSACLNDYVGWWPSCCHVLHIERVWSTIVSFLGASVQNVRQKLRKRLHTFVVFIHYKMPWSQAEVCTYMEQNKPSSVPEVLCYSAPSIDIFTLNIEQNILQGSGQGAGETDPYGEGGSD